MSRSYRSLYALFFIVWIVLSFLFFSGLFWYAHLHWILSLFFALSFGTFFLYGFDKFQSRGRGLRVPEAVLHATAFLGGTFGALFGMSFFRHKTKKSSFQFALALVLFVQIGVLLWLARYTSVFDQLQPLSDAFLKLIFPLVSSVRPL